MTKFLKAVLTIYEGRVQFHFQFANVFHLMKLIMDICSNKLLSWLFLIFITVLKTFFKY